VPVMEAAYKAAHEMYEQIAATNPNFKKALDSMTAFRSDQYQWWQVGEFSFDAFMIRMRNRA
jgi:TRAP-type mannitol/chloroaromatic compound transport system substrate-binding protein